MRLIEGTQRKVINLICTIGATNSQLRILSHSRYIPKKHMRHIIKRQSDYLMKLETLLKNIPNETNPRTNKDHRTEV